MLGDLRGVHWRDRVVGERRRCGQCLLCLPGSFSCSLSIQLGESTGSFFFLEGVDAVVVVVSARGAGWIVILKNAKINL